MYVRTYKRTLLWGARAGGPGYQLPLASILIRLDLTDDYEELVKKKVALLGPPAVSALYEVPEQVADGDEKRQAEPRRRRSGHSFAVSRARMAGWVR